jgi:hypothetical protein
MVLLGIINNYSITANLLEPSFFAQQCQGRGFCFLGGGAKATVIRRSNPES